MGRHWRTPDTIQDVEAQVAEQLAHMRHRIRLERRPTRFEDEREARRKLSPIAFERWRERRDAARGR
jgi:hypothetical protein